MENRPKIKEKKSFGLRRRIIRQFAAGGVVYKKTSNGLLWLVAKSSPSKLYPQDYWRLPKGWLDDRNDGKKPGPLATGKNKASEKNLQDAALREVAEEGGIEARIVLKIGTEKYFLRDKVNNIMIIKFVTFYLMEWAFDLSDGFGFETEKVEWLDFNKAHKKLTYSREKNILKKSASLV